MTRHQNIRHRRNVRLRSTLEVLERRQLLAADGLALVDDLYQVDQNAAAALIDVLANDTFGNDYAGDRRITAVSTGSLGGRVEVSADGSQLYYQPPADVSGSELFRYTVDHAQTAEVSVEITSPLKPFEATIDLFRDEYRFDLLAGAQFPDNYVGAKRVTLISETARGAELQITDDGQSVLYRPDPNLRVSDQFTYIVDNHYVATARIDIRHPLYDDRYEVLQNSGTTNLHVIANDFRVLRTDVDSGVDLRGNWSSAYFNAKVTHILDAPDDATVTIAPGSRSILFTPQPDQYGYQTFRYVVDGRFEQRVTVQVQRPVQDDRFDADVGGSIHVFDALTNDRYYSHNSQQWIRVVDRVTSVTAGDQGGQVEISADGSRIHYRPPPNFVGTETFEYVADDRHRATVQIQVASPVRDDWFTVAAWARNRIDVLANDFLDNASHVAEITAITESELGGVIELGSDGVIHYTPPETLAFAARAASGDSVPYTSHEMLLPSTSSVVQDSFQYTVNDQDTATANLQIRNPAISDRYSVDHPEGKVLSVLRNDLFVSGYLGEQRITAVSIPSSGGNVTIMDDGRNLMYHSRGVAESFTYTVDGRYTTTVSIEIIPRLAADHAVADQNGPEITIGVLSNDFWFIGDDYPPYWGPRTLTSVSSSEHGAVVSLTSDGKVSYTPPTDFVGQDTFSYTVDGFLSQRVRVDVVRRAADDTVHVAADSHDSALNLLANDILGADYNGPGQISAVTGSEAGAQVTISDDRGSVIYTPPPGFTGEDRFVYTVDGQSKANVTVIVQDSETRFPGKYESVEEFRDHVLELAIKRYQNHFGQPNYPVWSNSDGDAWGVKYFTSSASGVNHSETNVQVAGVDEHDIVETDGHFIYALRGSELIVSRSLPADSLAVVSRTQIEGIPIGMYLDGDRLAVLSRSHVSHWDSHTDAASLVAHGPALIYSPVGAEATTIVTVLDVRDRESPSVVQRTEFDAGIADSRRIDDQVFLVLRSNEILPKPQWICDEESGCRYETEEEFLARVTDDPATSIDGLLPSYESFDGSGRFVRGGPLLMPEDIYVAGDADTSMTAVVSINLHQNEPGLTATAGVTSESAGHIFASPTSLYVFSNQREPIENERWTSILKFDWNGDSGEISFAAKGAVPGTLLNQFSADERDGLLRVTTEISNNGTGNHSGQNETGVFVLQEDGALLEFVGSLQNLAVGQAIKSVRYFGDRVLVTNFDDADPLHAIDLSDSSHPRALGHVSLPGFSSYMQFIGPDRLLTVGMNTATGWRGRAMVSLFDVSDLTAPRLIDQHNLPRFSTSEANNDHHAFNWLASQGILSVPVSRRIPERYDADEDGYAEATRILRKDELSILHVGIDDTGHEGIAARGQVTHDLEVLRSVTINDHVYSVGLDGIRVVHPEDPDTLIDELLFDGEIVTNNDPRSPVEFRAVETAARDLLAAEMGLRAENLMMVASERRDGSLETVLRYHNVHYRLRGTDESNLELVQQDFEFPQNGHNRPNPLDVNGDGKLTAIDALMVINDLSRRGPDGAAVDQVMRQIRVTDRPTDTSGDGRITAIDALWIINEMARRRSGLDELETLST